MTRGNSGFLKKTSRFSKNYKMDDIIAVSGGIKSLEKKFLATDELARAVQSKSFGEFAGLLANSRYRMPQSPAKAEELTEFFETLTADLVKEMHKNLPVEIYRYFLLRYDYHNLKLIAETDADAAKKEKNYAVHSSSDYFTLKSALENNNYKDVPAHLKDALSFISKNREAEGLLLSLKKMYYRTAGELLRGFHSGFIDNCLRIEIDFANISTFIQEKMAGVQAGKDFFIDGGNVKKERFSTEEILWDAVGKQYQKVAVPVTAEGYDIARYTAVMDYVKAGRLVPYGIETVFGYFVGRQAELDNVRRMALGKFYNVDPKILSEWAVPPYQYV